MEEGLCPGQVRSGRLQRPGRNRQGLGELPHGARRGRNGRAVRHGVLHDAGVVDRREDARKLATDERRESGASPRIQCHPRRLC